MSPGFSRARRQRSRLWHFASVLALLVQCWVAGAPLADCRGEGMAAHVESAGNHGHFTHDEASCAACTILALRTITPRAEPLLPPALRVTVAPPAVLQSRGVTRLPQQQSRAPPVVG